MSTDTYRKYLKCFAGPVFLLTTSVFLTSQMILHFGVPAWRDMTDSQSNMQTVKELVAGGGETPGIHSRVLEKKAALETRLDSLTSGLTDPTDLSGLLQTIFDKGWEAGVKFDKTQPGEEYQGDLYRFFPIQLELRTNYHSLGKFVSSLERIPQVMRIDRLGIVAAEKGGGIEAALQVTCFIRKDG